MVQDFKRRVTSYRAFAIAAALGFSSNAIAESIQLSMHVAPTRPHMERDGRMVLERKLELTL
ncbi:hypothetical protein V1290_003895 [Bradyrhizobium sp. AZCC 1578]|uniref:hypothetical protein n=1 Tax=Bradyrhizobium sp. AZCC 1578 TaxID=3117027 RepID=UPI002FF041FB